MKRGVPCNDFSPEQTRAIRLALAAFGCRMEILSRCGESPSQALEATLREIRMSPSLLAEWIPYEPGMNEDLLELFQRNGKLLWRVLLSLKCDAGQRIFRGEEAQQAIRNAISEYSPSRSGGTHLSETPLEDHPVQTSATNGFPRDNSPATPMRSSRFWKTWAICQRHAALAEKSPALRLRPERMSGNPLRGYMSCRRCWPAGCRPYGGGHLGSCGSPESWSRPPRRGSASSFPFPKPSISPPYISATSGKCSNLKCGDHLCDPESM